MSWWDKVKDAAGDAVNAISNSAGDALPLIGLGVPPVPALGVAAAGNALDGASKAPAVTPSPPVVSPATAGDALDAAGKKSDQEMGKGEQGNMLDQDNTRRRYSLYGEDPDIAASVERPTLFGS